MAISVALGFDCFVVIRHGVSDDETSEDSEQSRSDLNIVPGSQLGCYFCNDVTAPGNSSVDRTMDQQCTVNIFMFFINHISFLCRREITLKLIFCSRSKGQLVIYE